MSTFNEVHAQDYYHRGELIDFSLRGKDGEDGKTITVTVDGTETIINGLDGKDANIEFQIIKVVDGMFTIVLPVASAIPEFGLYYYKDITETNTTFTDSNGNIMGNFYHHRKQHIKFQKSGRGDDAIWI